LSNLFLSRSAPTGGASGAQHAQCASFSSVNGSQPDEEVPQSPLSEATASTVAPRGVSPPSSGYYVKVIDLAPLLASSSPPPHHPTVISEFKASTRLLISNIAFTGDGNSLIVSTEDGRVTRVFNIRPLSSVSRCDLVPCDVGSTGPNVSDPWHVYNLRRGHTSATIEDISVSQDGRWIAMGTSHRTVHVFAVNPYGGKPDNRSHLEGRVHNVFELVSTIK